MWAELVRDRAEKLKQVAMMEVSNRDFTVLLLLAVE